MPSAAGNPVGLVEFLLARLEDAEAAAKAATGTEWQWWNLEHRDQGWSDNGPSLQAVTDEWRSCSYYCSWTEPDSNHRGPQQTPGHEHREAPNVISAWGHDAWGIEVSAEDAAFIAANDPAYVLQDIAAKQKLVAYWSLAFTNPADVQFAGPDWDKVRRAGEWTLRLLAAPFSSHPDWQPEWSVE